MAGGAQGATASPVLHPASPIAPRRPHRYRLPSRFVAVRTSEGLVRALRRRSPVAIILANGDYTTAGTSSSERYFFSETGHRLYARHLGKAVLHVGLVFGGGDGPGGGEVHGLAFDVGNPGATEDSAALDTWGANGARTKICDSIFEGHRALESGIRANVVTGLVVQRVVVRHFRRYGVFLSDNDRRSRAAAAKITDLNIASIKERVPGTDDGRAEYGLWIGNTVRAPVARVRIRDFGWSGLWTGNNANDVRVRDFVIDGSARRDGNAVYIEHMTRRTVFERFRLGPHIKEGFVSEWDYGTDPTGAGIDNTVQNGVIDTNKARVGRRFGVLADDGTVRMTIRRVRFLHADFACIIDRGRGTVIGANDYRRRDRGAATVTSDSP